jgi:hypothetical protein
MQVIVFTKKGCHVKNYIFRLILVMVTSTV